MPDHRQRQINLDYTSQPSLQHRYLYDGSLRFGSSTTAPKARIRKLDTSQTAR